MRAVNFCAGPCTLPLSVLEEAQAEFVDYAGTGMALIEMSHRSKEYDQVHNETLDLVRSLFAVPEEFEILLLQGGATLQFAMVPPQPPRRWRLGRLCGLRLMGQRRFQGRRSSRRCPPCLGRFGGRLHEDADD